MQGVLWRRDDESASGGKRHLHDTVRTSAAKLDCASKKWLSCSTTHTHRALDDSSTSHVVTGRVCEVTWLGGQAPTTRRTMCLVAMRHSSTMPAVLAHAYTTLRLYSGAAIKAGKRRTVKPALQEWAVYPAHAAVRRLPRRKAYAARQ